MRVIKRFNFNIINMEKAIPHIGRFAITFAAVMALTHNQEVLGITLLLVRISLIFTKKN